MDTHKPDCTPSNSFVRILPSHPLPQLYYNNYVKDQMDFMQTVDEIYERVDHLEPWMSGNDCCKQGKK